MHLVWDILSRWLMLEPSPLASPGSRLTANASFSACGNLAVLDETLLDN